MISIGVTLNRLPISTPTPAWSRQNVSRSEPLFSGALTCASALEMNKPAVGTSATSEL